MQPAVAACIQASCRARNSAARGLPVHLQVHIGVRRATITTPEGDPLTNSHTIFPLPSPCGVVSKPRIFAGAQVRNQVFPYGSRTGSQCNAGLIRAPRSTTVVVNQFNTR